MNLDELFEAISFAFIAILGYTSVGGSIYYIICENDKGIKNEWKNWNTEEKLSVILGMLLSIAFTIISIIKFKNIF